MSDLTPEAFEQRAAKAEQLVATLQTKLAELRKLKEADEIAQLAKENEKLKKLVAEKKAALVAAETANGKVQVALPGQPGYVAPGAAPARAAAPAAGKAAPAPAPAPAPAKTTAAPAASSEAAFSAKAGAIYAKQLEAGAAVAELKKAKAPKDDITAAVQVLLALKKEYKEETGVDVPKPGAPVPAFAGGKGKAPAGAPAGASTEKKKKPKKAAAPAAAEVVVDVSRLLLKVACIKSAVLHPDADGLYLEDAETGEPENRVVISGLVGKIPIEEMQNRMVILCMNMKPVKMRGIFSTAMVMCANDPDKGVEIIDPPAGSVPGDIIVIPGYTADDKPADVQLNPKKKVLEALLPDLFTNDAGVATYKGAEWEVAGKGKCKAKSLFNAKIK